jgi:hypothetical protein
LKHFAFCWQTISAEGTVCDALFYILEGKVKLTVLSTHGKEATIAVLNEGDFFREAYLAGQALRMGATTAQTDCKVMQIETKEMMLALQREHVLCDMFTAYLVGNNIRYKIVLRCACSLCVIYSAVGWFPLFSSFRSSELSSPSDVFFP